MKRLALLLVLITGALLIYGSLYFPDWADPHSPASQHVSPYYIEQTFNDTALPNIVSAVLADYRSYDTMFETAVIFAAGLACFFLLRTFKSERARTRMYRHLPTRLVIHVDTHEKRLDLNDNFERMDTQWTPYDLITRTTCRIIIPFIQIFALYVIAHGHHSPGGGFQGGVIFGASVILFALSHSLRSTIKRLPEKSSALYASIGVFIFAGTGMLCLILGADFLDYYVLADLFRSSLVMARSHGILVVEIGVGLSVLAVMIWLYYNLSSGGKHKEGL